MSSTRSERGNCGRYFLKPVALDGVPIGAGRGQAEP